MTNIKNYNYSNVDLVLSNAYYWDFYLSTDTGSSGIYTGNTSGDCFVIGIDFNDNHIYSTGITSANTITSNVFWTGGTNSGYTLNTFGLTGIDNGFITFNKPSGDTSNEMLLSALTGSTLVITSGDLRFHMTRITGTTDEYIYPIDIIKDTTYGDFARFCGGFYQGYYKIDGTTYNVLPTRVNYSWVSEFWLRPNDSVCSGYTGTTLNDVNPNNTGFFFYLGTRAENKFWNIFHGADTGCTSGCTSPSGCTDIVSEWCTVPKETDIAIINEYGFAIPLSPPQVEMQLITNPFLIYGRAVDLSPKPITGLTGSVIYNPSTTGSSNYCSCYKCGGSHDGLGTKTICSYDGNGIIVTKVKQITTNKTNPFLIYGRAYSGNSVYCGCGRIHSGFGDQTVCTFSGVTSPQTTIDYNLDILDNAIGFRIKDDGSIGYRLLTVTGSCINSGLTYTSGITIHEEYSISGLVKTNIWSNIVLRFIADEYLDDCELLYKSKRNGKLMVYINGYLKHTFNNFSEFIARRLTENKGKQIGVPFNISLGGGSQGLIESQTFDGIDLDDRNLPIQTNFAGSFIGDISQFKFNICDLTYSDIQYNFKINKTRYGII